jgi:hypothetical protein
MVGARVWTFPPKCGSANFIISHCGVAAPLSGKNQGIPEVLLQTLAKTPRKNPPWQKKDRQNQTHSLRNMALMNAALLSCCKRLRSAYASFRFLSSASGKNRQESQSTQRLQ